jgi:hypothetical protein
MTLLSRNRSPAGFSGTATSAWRSAERFNPQKPGLQFILCCSPFSLPSVLSYVELDGLGQFYRGKR